MYFVLPLNLSTLIFVCLLCFIFLDLLGANLFSLGCLLHSNTKPIVTFILLPHTKGHYNQININAMALDNKNENRNGKRKINMKLGRLEKTG